MRAQFLAALVLAALFLSCLSPALAQPANLAGVVKSPAGEPVISAQVKLIKDGRIEATTYTNLEGRFTFRSVAGEPAQYSLEASAPGRQPVRQPGGRFVTLVFGN